MSIKTQSYYIDIIQNGIMDILVNYGVMNTQDIINAKIVEKNMKQIRMGLIGHGISDTKSLKRKRGFQEGMRQKTRTRKLNDLITIIGIDTDEERDQIIKRIAEIYNRRYL